MRQSDLAGAAHLEVVSGVVQLRPEDAMFEAMLRGWRAKRLPAGCGRTRSARGSRPMWRSSEFTSGYPWAWTAGRWMSGRCR